MKKKIVIIGYSGYNYNCVNHALMYVSETHTGENIRKGWSGYIEAAKDLTEMTVEERLEFLQTVMISHVKTTEFYEIKEVYYLENKTQYW